MSLILILSGLHVWCGGMCIGYIDCPSGGCIKNGTSATTTCLLSSYSPVCPFGAERCSSGASTAHLAGASCMDKVALVVESRVEELCECVLYAWMMPIDSIEL
ncbi:hypothetical protein BC939DRAFT_493357 [Gamsiella multidivaricata]|uniref:uncharacterized protein n=1 Tax=Gamsiella multidivaricata TaxID=101098 RepID=UPI00221E8241|nr:uncharacterized protein BC939DRAFT_493357 [Gamsiella multidivaricata]KAI7822895.1 hypothetical protein BC939DRAFT_493357 [Gamsiella multidivaricata]